MCFRLMVCSRDVRIVVSIRFLNQRRQTNVMFQKKKKKITTRRETPPPEFYLRDKLCIEAAITEIDGLQKKDLDGRASLVVVDRFDAQYENWPIMRSTLAVRRKGHFARRRASALEAI